MRLWRLAPVAVCALALTACGGGGGALSVDPVAKAADKTASVTSAHMTMDMTESVGPSGRIHFTMTGDSDNANHTARFALDLTDLKRLDPHASGNDADWRGDAVIVAPKGTYDVYVRLPVLSTALHATKPWLELDLQKLGETQGTNFSALVHQFDNENPTQALQVLKSTGSVRKVGTAEVDGTQTTQYVASIDVRKMAARLRGAGPSLNQALQRAGVKRIPVDVWIGSDGLVRKMNERFTERVPNAGSLSMNMTLTLSNFNQPVNIQVPPASDVENITPLVLKYAGTSG